MTVATPPVERIDHAEAPGAVILRIHRPEVRNALAAEHMLEASRILADCQHDARVQVVFITGSSGAFCAGADLKALNAQDSGARAQSIAASTELMTRIVNTPKIVVAAVNGASAGLGNHIAICADLCFASSDATFNFTGAVKGIPSLQYGALLLPMAIGMKRAKALLLRGGRLTAQRALELGLCNEVFAPERWDAEIAAIAQEFAGRDAATLAHNKLQANQFAYQMAGALQLSALAGAAHMAAKESFVTGGVHRGKGSA
ncbi:MAG: enoyl-CoA hydratase/isomerase family protein [Lautropia sp.]